jgi:hypothetical protein
MAKRIARFEQLGRLVVVGVEVDYDPVGTGQLKLNISAAPQGRREALAYLTPALAQRFHQYDALADVGDALRMELSVPDRVAMPRETCAAAVRQLPDGVDPFDLRVIRAR